MESRRLLAMLVTLAAIVLASIDRIEASHLRNGRLRALKEISPPPPIKAQSDSGSAEIRLPDATQDSHQVTKDGHSGASASDLHSIENEIQLASSAVADQDGVKAWAQCGGIYYRGPTKCVRHTFCKQLSEFISVCFPETKPTESIVMVSSFRRPSLSVLLQALQRVQHEDASRFRTCHCIGSRGWWWFAEDFVLNKDGDTRLLLGDDSTLVSDTSTDSRAASSGSDDDAETPSTPAAQPIPNGVQMFGQCGGISYTGTTVCYDPDAYCKQLSISISICSPKPVA
ncbi:hypothetical protein PHYBOEH_010162 [Phytophthora boehmeriae]|uniref:CBM1 domain-containing protein n=1 Tax=Phytophthora boehmeriae TaxID=109152 RepID=A0A8T1VP74_9STRA|nr:hypothetical protein PHYBOEH_010162 [Phytophthora boehmeriae]